MKEESTMISHGDYYSTITQTDIGAIAEELLRDRITDHHGSTIYCDCPNHQSQSKRSLHIMTDRQGWYCFGCGKGGDVLHLVEFIQSGVVTTGLTGAMPDSHRKARDFLAEKAGLAPLGNFSSEHIDNCMEYRRFSGRVHEVLTRMAEFYHERLMYNREVLDWYRKQYGISDEMTKRLLIGYAENSPRTAVSIKERMRDLEFTKEELGASGAFKIGKYGPMPLFDNRLVFPYWSRNKVVFAIGRKTPWTPNEDWEKPKYKKLWVYHPNTKKQYASQVANNHLYNEDVLLKRPEEIVITEGVTDCISLMEHGIEAISPVTVRIRKEDWGRILEKLSGVKIVYLCQDNEISEVGLKSALETAERLGKKKIKTRIVVLPLDEKQRRAREELADRFGVTTNEDAQRRKKDITDEEQLKELEVLLSDSKLDVNEWFRAGHTADDFRTLLEKSQTPIAYGVHSIPADIDGEARSTALLPILEAIAGESKLEMSRYVDLISDHFGDAISKRAVSSQVSELAKKKRRSSRNKNQNPNAAEGSCLSAINNLLTELPEGSSLDYQEVAEVVYNWIEGHGGRFYFTAEEPMLFMDGKIWHMDSGNKGLRRRYTAYMQGLTRIVSATGSGRIFFDAMCNLAFLRGKQQKQLTWIHSDLHEYAVYFNLNNDDNELVKITPDGIEIIKNGGNADNILLASSNKIRPIRYMPDADHEKVTRLLQELFIDKFACYEEDRLLIILWVCCFLLIDFSGTKPMTRFEGGAGSGKTTAAKLITTLIYGEQQQKKATDAANYTDGSQNPLISLDNVEAKQMTDELISFMLTSITGVAKEKRQRGTDTGIVSERTRCLINSTGIEPLGADLAEVLGRSFIAQFDLRLQKQDEPLIEAVLIAKIQRHRDEILSVIFQWTSNVLRHLSEGRQYQVMSLIHQTAPNHSKKRCNEYLAIMYLMMHADEPDEVLEEKLCTLDRQFVALLDGLNITTKETARESNQIATVLGALFRSYEKAKDNYTTDKWCEHNQINIVDDEIVDVSAAELFVALSNAAVNYRLKWEYNTVQQFVQRFYSDMHNIMESGYEIQVIPRSGNRRFYTIRPMKKPALAAVS